MGPGSIEVVKIENGGRMRAAQLMIGDQLYIFGNAFTIYDINDRLVIEGNNSIFIKDLKLHALGTPRDLYHTINVSLLSDQTWVTVFDNESV